jgi:hypothetical protein
LSGFRLVACLSLLAGFGCATAEGPDEDDGGWRRDDAADRSDADLVAEDGTSPDDGGADADFAPDADAADADAAADADTADDGHVDAADDVAVDVDAPPGPCSGTSLGGHCWYLGEVEHDCASACTSHGGYAEGTRTYAGSDGTNAHCDEVLDALGVAGERTSTLSASFVGAGCFYMNMVDVRYRVADTPTNATATYTLARRACACVN